METVKNIDAKLKKIVAYGSFSNKFTNELKTQQKILDPECIPLILKSDCPTRWNNKYLVWERILKLRKPLINTLMEAQSWPGAKNTSIYDIEITPLLLLLWRISLKYLITVDEVQQSLSL